MGARDLKKNWRKPLNALIFVALLVAVFFLVDLRSVGSALLGVSTVSIGLALFVATLDRVLMTYKWRQLLIAIGCNLRFLTALRIHYQSVVSGRIIPAPLGADVLRVYLTTAVGLPHAPVISSVALEKLVAMLASIVIAIAGLLFLADHTPEGAQPNSFLGIAAGTLLAAISMFGMILLARAHRWVGLAVDWFDNRGFVPERLNRSLRQISRSILMYRNKTATLAINGMLALAEHCTQVVKLAILAFGLGLAMPVLSFCAIAAVALFVRRIGGIVEGWGLGEGSAILTLVWFGIDAELAVALLVANFVVSTTAVAPGLIFFYTHPVLPAEKVSEDTPAQS